MAEKIIGAKASQAAFKEGEGAGIKKFTLTSNLPEEDVDQKTVSLVNGIMSFTYYESILQDCVRSTVTFTDSGDSVESDGKKMSVMEGLPVYGTERADITVSDNNKGVIKVRMYVNKPDNMSVDTRKSLVILNLASKEFFDNEKVRLNKRFDGKIANGETESEEGGTIEKILQKDEKYLNTKKEIYIEETANERNFCGNNWKPFYTINWLARQSVPAKDENPEAAGNSAGFMFWETAAGFHFKSIDGLMNTETNKAKRSYIYNETTDMAGCELPEGYDAKVLELQTDNRVDVQQKLNIGAYSTRTWTFNPYDSSIEILYPNSFLQGAELIESNALNTQGNQEFLEKAGERLPYWNPELNQNLDFSRTEFRVLDIGVLPTGKGSGEGKDNEQIGEVCKKDREFGYSQVLNQGNMRMNQLFASKVTITVPGDFTLRAGDMVRVDIPGLRDNKDEKGTDELDKQVGGDYIIGSLCHHLDGSHTLTKMDLIRHSFGRKPKKRVNVQSLSDEERDLMAGTIVDDSKGGESYVFDSKTQNALDALSDK